MITGYRALRCVHGWGVQRERVVYLVCVCFIKAHYQYYTSEFQRNEYVFTETPQGVKNV